MDERRGLRDPGVLAWLRLMRVSQRIGQAAAVHLQRWGLSPAQFDVLAHVGAAPEMTQQELADSLLVTKGNVCQLLDRMEQAGLIVRRPDGRSNRLSLTKTGQELFDEVVPAHEALIGAQFAALSVREQVQLLSLLRRLDRALG